MMYGSGTCLWRHGVSVGTQDILERRVSFSEVDEPKGSKDEVLWGPYGVEKAKALATEGGFRGCHKKLAPGWCTSRFAGSATNPLTIGTMAQFKGWTGQISSPWKISAI